MNCFNEQQIFDFINNELADHAHIDIEKHIQDCGICRSIYEQKNTEIKSIKTSMNDFDDSEIEIPDFVFPENRKTIRSIRISPLLLKLSIAATILIFISLSILSLNNKDKQDMDLQLMQIQQEMAITDMNEAWHQRELIITQIDNKTGNTEVFLSSEF